MSARAPCSLLELLAERELVVEAQDAYRGLVAIGAGFDTQLASATVVLGHVDWLLGRLIERFNAQGGDSGFVG